MVMIVVRLWEKMTACVGSVVISGSVCIDSLGHVVKILKAFGKVGVTCCNWLSVQYFG